MRIHQKMVIFFKKMMKAYFKAVILLIKTDENIVKLNFLIPPPLGMLTVYTSCLRGSFIDVKNDKEVIFLWVH